MCQNPSESDNSAGGEKWHWVWQVVDGKNGSDEERMKGCKKRVRESNDDVV